MAGAALLAVAPLLFADRRNEIAVELSKSLESGQAEIRCKYDGDCDCYECVLNWLRKEETK